MAVHIFKMEATCREVTVEMVMLFMLKEVAHCRNLDLKSTQQLIPGTKIRLKNCISCPQNFITLKKIIKLGIFYIFNFGFGPLHD